MNNDKYIKEVLKLIWTDRRTKRRIKEDLINRIDEAMNEDVFFNAYVEMGSPEELAADFMDNLDDITRDFKFITKQYKPYEYKSKIKIFGLPLVHINTSGAKGSEIAKGIIAVGDIAYGVFALGGVSIGVFTIGGVSIGIGSLGGVAIGIGALGGVAVGGFADGAVAIGLVKLIGDLIALI